MDTRTPPYFFMATAYFVPPLDFTVLFTLLEGLVDFLTIFVVFLLTDDVTLNITSLIEITISECTEVVFSIVEGIRLSKFKVFVDDEVGVLDNDVACVNICFPPASF